MSFNKIKEYHIPYKDKADGQIIDPVEWNANFIHIEQISDENRQIINEAIDSILNDGANTILIDEAVTGTKEELKSVLLHILDKFSEYYNVEVIEEKLTGKMNAGEGDAILEEANEAMTAAQTASHIALEAKDAAEKARDEAQQATGGNFVTNTAYKEDTEKIIEHIDTRVIISEVEISNLTQEEAGRYANGWNKVNATDLYYFYNLPTGENISSIDDIVDLNLDLDSLAIAEECGLKSVVKTFDISTTAEAKFLARIYAETIPSAPMNATMIIHKGGDFSWL